MQKNYTLNMAFYIIIFILIVGGVYYLMNRDNSVTENPQENNNVVQDSGYVETDLPEGVEIVERDGERVVDNDLDGYEIQINNKVQSINYEGGMLSISESNDAEIIENTRYDIVFYNLNDNTLESWVKQWIDEQEASQDYNYEMIDTTKGVAFVIHIPSYAGSQKALVFQQKDQVLFIDAIFEDPIKIFNNLSLN